MPQKDTVSSTFIVYPAGGDKQVFASTIGQISSKLGTTDSLVLIGFSEEEQNKISDSKGGKQLTEKNQLSFIHSFNTLRDALSDETKQLVFTPFHLFADALNIDSAQNELSVFLPAVSKTTKPSLIHRLSDVARKVFSNTHEKQVDNRVLVAKSETFSLLLNEFDLHKTEYASSCSEILQKFRLLGIKAKEETFAAKQLQKPTGIVKHKLSAIGLFWSLKKEWFFTKPLSDIKQKKDPDYSNGNHGVYRLAFGIMVLFLLLFMPIISQQFGTTWDEPDNHEYAEDILKYFFTLGEDKSCFDITKGVYSHLINYGLFFDTFAALVNKVSPLGLYETRHLLNALVGLLAMIFSALLARKLWSWRAANIALWLIFLTPVFFGHSMNNPKDIPFAAGYVLSLYYLVNVLRELPRPRFSNLFWLTLSLSFIISIRIGGLLATGIVGLFIGLTWLLQAYKDGIATAFKLVPRYFVMVLSVAVISYVLGILPWPYGHSAPIDNPMEALSSFTKFSNVTIYENFEGERIFMNEVPWYYTPKFIGITTPVVVLLGLLLSFLPLFLTQKIDKALYAMLWFTVVFPIGYAAYGESTLYNGWRHFLFVYPALVPLAASGWEFLLSRKQKVAGAIASLLLIAGLGKVLVWSVQHHPHNYTYYNALIGGYAGAYGNYEGDSYGNGLRAALDWVIDEVPEVDKERIIVRSNFTPSTGKYWAKQQSDSVVVGWVREHERYKSDWDYAIFGTRTYSPEQLKNGGFPPAGTIHTIDVDGAPLIAIVKRENDFFTQAYDAYEKGNSPKAVEYFQKAADYDPNNEEAWRMLGVSAISAGDLNLAKTALDKAIELDPESHIAHGYMGMYYIRQMKVKEALEYFVKASDLKINYSFAYLQQGYIYSQLQQKREALLSFYKFMMAQASEQGKIHKLKGETDLKKWEDNLNVTSLISSNIFMEVGSLYNDLGNLNLAAQYFGYAISVDPNNANAYQNLAIILNKQGQREKAQQFLQKAQQLRSGN